MYFDLCFERTEKMNEEEKEQTAGAIPDEADGRPPVDPKNKLYTVISLLIFAVIYVGGEYVKDNFTLRYALFCDSFTSAEETAITEEVFGDTEIPPGTSLKFARYHRNFDRDCFYAAFEVPEEYFEDGTEKFAEERLPYAVGDPEEDVRLTVFSRPDNVPDFVYGDSYVCIDDPKKSCMIYGGEDGFTAVFQAAGYEGAGVDILRESGVKIPVR